MLRTLFVPKMDCECASSKRNKSYCNARMFATRASYFCISSKHSIIKWYSVGVYHNNLPRQANSRQESVTYYNHRTRVFISCRADHRRSDESDHFNWHFLTLWRIARTMSTYYTQFVINLGYSNPRDSGQFDPNARRCHKWTSATSI